MDTKPELIRLEALDPNASGSNMYIKNEVLYHVESQNHHIKKEDPKVYYDTHHQVQHTKSYIPDPVQHFHQTKPISQYPKYQTPKLRAKSSYSPMKQMPSTNSQQHNMYMKQENPHQEIIIEHLSHNSGMLNSRQQRGVQNDHNTVQVITPNANYGNQHWSSDVTMTPIMEQTIQTEHGHLAATGTPDAIFIPEGASGSSVISENSSEYNPTPTINLIPVMTPNGLVFVASNNAGGINESQSQHTQQPPNTPTPRGYNRRKQPTNKRVQPQIQNSQQVEIIASHNMTPNGGNHPSNLIYTQNGPLLLLNESRGQQQVEFKPIINSPPAPVIPGKGTVIEEPPKAIYQSRYNSDINENR